MGDFSPAPIAPDRRDACGSSRRAQWGASPALPGAGRKDALRHAHIAPPRMGRCRLASPSRPPAPASTEKQPERRVELRVSAANPPLAALGKFRKEAKMEALARIAQGNPFLFTLVVVLAVAIALWVISHP